MSIDRNNNTSVTPAEYHYYVKGTQLLTKPCSSVFPIRRYDLETSSYYTPSDFIEIYDNSQSDFTMHYHIRCINHHFEKRIQNQQYSNVIIHIANETLILDFNTMTLVNFLATNPNVSVYFDLHNCNVIYNCIEDLEFHNRAYFNLEDSMLFFVMPTTKEMLTNNLRIDFELTDVPFSLSYAQQHNLKQYNNLNTKLINQRIRLCKDKYPAEVFSGSAYLNNTYLYFFDETYFHAYEAFIPTLSLTSKNRGWLNLISDIVGDIGNFRKEIDFNLKGLQPIHPPTDYAGLNYIEVKCLPDRSREFNIHIQDFSNTGLKAYVSYFKDLDLLSVEEPLVHLGSFLEHEGKLSLDSFLLYVASCNKTTIYFNRNIYIYIYI